MQSVQEEVFYHIHRSNNPDWKLGAEMFFGRSLNAFLGFYDDHYKRILDPTTKREFPVNFVAHSAYGTLARQLPKDAVLESFYHYDPVRCLGETLETLDHYLRLVREFVFEEVRQSSFPHLPSRHRCIWLIPHDSESLAYWTSTLSGNQQIFEVSVTGKIHRASQEYLTLGTPPLNKLRQLAFKYWSGVSGTDSNQDEILCEGFVKIISVVSANTTS